MKVGQYTPLADLAPGAIGIEMMLQIVMPIILALLAAGTAIAVQRFGACPGATWPQRAPFLGGGQPATHAWQRFHIRYYPMTLLFVAFEMEMMFMYPWAVVYVETGLKAMAEMGMFLGILSIGILYGWREGVFRWQ